MIAQRKNGLANHSESELKDLQNTATKIDTKSLLTKEAAEPPPPPTPKSFKNTKKHADAEKSKQNGQSNQQQPILKKRSWFRRSKSVEKLQAPPVSSVVTSIPKLPATASAAGNTGTGAATVAANSSKSSLSLTASKISRPQIPRSRSWFFKSKNKSATTLTHSSGSSESEHIELLSTESVDTGTSIMTVIRKVEEDDSIPIVYGNYSGEPTFKKQIEEPTIFQAQLAKFNNFDRFDEAAYFFWNIWEIDESGKKKIVRIIECSSDFTDIFRNFTYEKVFIMRSSLIPNYNSFKNGYLVKLKLLHGKTATNAELGLHLFVKCCKNSILNNVPNNAINVNVCGYTYARKSSMTSITLWIHPILNMSFDISNQVRLLIQSLNFGINLNKITLVDINNNSKTLINTDLT
ncbi:hypothetical protein KGF56_002712 [Candida oxycetoniae]|uniref:Uncharacterized protein n=1 Tax=Candida oxycetoniae TaxID=497107 RepID=A0AAI9SXB6_9ASCO|nr:uncharacterized protein KGF56_002712 [Candida oxycetoniae]KAI3404520.2 hypothetical protein KGF56_002712 [Candida oxycetoniae]